MSISDRLHESTSTTRSHLQHRHDPADRPPPPLLLSGSSHSHSGVSDSSLASSHSALVRSHHRRNNTARTDDIDSSAAHPKPSKRRTPRPSYSEEKKKLVFASSHAAQERYRHSARAIERFLATLSEEEEEGEEEDEDGILTRRRCTASTVPSLSYGAPQHEETAAAAAVGRRREGRGPSISAASAFSSSSFSQGGLNGRRRRSLERSEISSLGDTAEGVQRVCLIDPSPLAAALAAQWEVTQAAASAAVEEASDASPREMARIEKEVLSALSRLPEEVETIYATATRHSGGAASFTRSSTGEGESEEAPALRERLTAFSEDFLPYVVAFTAAPLPSRRTQSAALAAVDAVRAYLLQRLSAEAAGEAEAGRVVMEMLLLQERSDALEAFAFGIASLSRDLLGEVEERSSLSAADGDKTGGKKKDERVGCFPPSSWRSLALRLEVLRQFAALVLEGCQRSDAVRRCLGSTKSGMISACLQGLTAILAVKPHITSMGVPPGTDNSDSVMSKLPQRLQLRLSSCFRDIGCILLLILGAHPQPDQLILRGSVLGPPRSSDDTAPIACGAAQEALCRPILTAMAMHLVDGTAARWACRSDASDSSVTEGTVDSDASQMMILCLYTRLLVLLTHRSTFAFLWVIEEATRRRGDAHNRTFRPEKEKEETAPPLLCVLFCNLCASRWANVVELAALWFVAMARRLALAPEEEMVKLPQRPEGPREILEALLRYAVTTRPDALRRLLAALSWGLEGMDPHAPSADGVAGAGEGGGAAALLLPQAGPLMPVSASVALCWRWMILVDPATMCTWMWSQREVCMGFVELLLQLPAAWLRSLITSGGDQSRSRSKPSPAHLTPETALWITELGFSFAVAYASADSHTQREGAQRHLGSAAAAAARSTMNAATRASLCRRLQHIILETLPDVCLAELAAVGVPSYASSRFVFSSPHAAQEPQVWRHGLLTAVREALEGRPVTKRGSPSTLPMGRPPNGTAQNVSTNHERSKTPVPALRVAVVHRRAASSPPSMLPMSPHSGPPVVAEAARPPSSTSHELSRRLSCVESGLPIAQPAPSVTRDHAPSSFRSYPPEPSPAGEASSASSAAEAERQRSERSSSSFLAITSPHLIALSRRYRVVSHAAHLPQEFQYSSIMTLLRLAQHCETLPPEGSVGPSRPSLATSPHPVLPSADSDGDSGNSEEGEEPKTPKPEGWPRRGPPPTRLVAALPRHTAAAPLAEKMVLPFRISPAADTAMRSGEGQSRRGPSWLRSSVPPASPGVHTPRRAVSSATVNLGERSPYPTGVSPPPRPPVVSTVVGAASAPRPNPWAPVQKRHPGRQWTVEALERDDVLLFFIPTREGASEGDEAALREALQEAMAAVTAHVKHLHEARRVCPSNRVVRRCVLLDLYVNVYPKVYLMLDHFLAAVSSGSPRFSHSAQRVLRRSAEGIHSGNLMERFDMVTHCEV